MNTTRRKQLIDTCGLLRSRGWQVDMQTKVNSFDFHNGVESPHHATIKLLLCKAVKDEGYSFATEVTHDTRGTVDVLDIHEGEKGSYIYEVETDCDRETELEKAKQYTDGFDADEIADVFVVDPSDVPEGIEETWQWAQEKVVA